MSSAALTHSSIPPGPPGNAVLGGNEMASRTTLSPLSAPSACRLPNHLRAAGGANQATLCYISQLEWWGIQKLRRLDMLLQVKQHHNIDFVQELIWPPRRETISILLLFLSGAFDSCTPFGLQHVCLEASKGPNIQYFFFFCSVSIVSTNLTAVLCSKRQKDDHSCAMSNPIAILTGKRHMQYEDTCSTPCGIPVADHDK